MSTNKYILDVNVLNFENLTIVEFLTLLSLHDMLIPYKIEHDIVKKLEEKQFVKIDIENINNIVVREKGKLLIDSLNIENNDDFKNKKSIRKSSRAITNELDEFLLEFRNLWKGLKPGSMGSYMGCREKMFRWMKDNPNYTKHDILKAAKMYIKSLNDYTFLQGADYFIYKKDKYGESSRLSAFIDEEEIKEIGWSSNLN